MILKEADWYLAWDCALAEFKVTEVDLYFSATKTEASCPGKVPPDLRSSPKKDSAERYQKFKSNYPGLTGFAEEARDAGRESSASLASEGLIGQCPLPPL